MSTPKLTPAAETRCAPDDCYHAPTGICAPGHCQRQSAKPRRIDDHMTRARRLVEDHISAYGMVPHPDRIKEVIAEQSQQSFDLGFRAAGGIVEPPSPAGTSAAKTPVSSPQSGEGELLREALEELQTHREAWRGALEDLAANGTDTSVRDGDETYWQHELKVFDRVFAALTPAPRDQGSIQATSSASATVCDHLTMEKADSILIPCPFCQSELGPRIYTVENWNGERVTSEVSYVECEACGAKGAEAVGPKAIEAWNRAANSPASLIANQKNLRGSEPETAPAGDASSRCDTGSKVR